MRGFLYIFMKYLQKHPVFVFFSVIVLSFYIYIGIFWLVWLILQIIPGAILLSILLYFTRKDKSQTYKNIFSRAFFSFVSLIWVIILWLWVFIGYNFLRPASLSDITLSNGSGTVVFMGMSHIANPDFYIQKNQKILSYSQSGYTILMEWVHPGTEENTKKFDLYMGFQFTKTFYSTFAHLWNLVVQENKELYKNANPVSLVSVDLSIDEIVALLEKNWAQKISSTSSQFPPDIESQIQESMQLMTSGEKHFMALLFRSILSTILRNSDDIESAIVDDASHHELFQVILHERNTPIISYIRDHSDQNIVIVYGGLHFNDIYKAIQQFSPAWKIQNIDTYYPYK